MDVAHNLKTLNSFYEGSVYMYIAIFVHSTLIKVVFEVVFVPETWAAGMAATIFQLTVKQRFRNPLVVHTDHMSCPAHLRVDEERFYAYKSTLL